MVPAQAQSTVKPPQIDLSKTQQQQHQQQQDDNPFRIPTNEEIFTVKEDRKRIREAERKALARQALHERGTCSSAIKGLAADSTRKRDKFASARHQGPKATAAEGAVHKGGATPSRRRGRENVKEFLAKKREIFLVQMGLDTKQLEINKLEERAMRREEALKRSEQMLEVDALRFDAFLKENDERVQDAIHKAENEAKNKQEKVIEIKRLNTQAAVIRSELNKLEEQLEDCRKYRAFLDRITPAEHFSAAENARAEKRRLQIESWQADCDALKQQKRAARAAETEARARVAGAHSQQEATRAEAALAEAVQAAREMHAIKEPGMPAEEVAEEAEQPMYFQEPRMLLAVFKELEEGNLFLIQNAQEGEEGLEDARQEMAAVRGRLDAEASDLSSQYAWLHHSCAAAKARCELLREQARPTTEAPKAGSTSQQATLEQLSAKIIEVYQQCGFDKDASLSILQMLTNVENKLEEQLVHVSTIPKDVAEAAERAREKDRRTVAREEKLQYQKQEHEARVKRAMERAAAPVFKKQGKQDMFRSRLRLHQKRQTGFSARAHLSIACKEGCAGAVVVGDFRPIGVLQGRLVSSLRLSQRTLAAEGSATEHALQQE
ncbi:hypothetical protein WJX74_006464 [Apatococcus lobatus]|uniref:DUF4200 domain-containing protein n=1 Tax=Apatococcus lobatus TaxID=904363 RepID=A0AAW1RHH0_9CHLO